MVSLPAPYPPLPCSHAQVLKACYFSDGHNAYPFLWYAVSSVDASQTAASPEMLQDHVAILSATVLVGVLLAANVVLLCIILVFVSRRIKSNQKNGGPHEYTYPRFSLSNSGHSRRAPIPPPRPQIVIGPQEDYEYVSSNPPDRSSRQ